MDITIDTTHPLNDRDRAMLRALLQTDPAAPTAPPAPAVAARTGHSPADLGSATRLAAEIGRAARAPGQAADAKRPVSEQPGVSLTESTREDSDSAG